MSGGRLAGVAVLALIASAPAALAADPPAVPVPKLERARVRPEPAWRSRRGPTEWSDGPVHRAMMLHRYLRTEIKQGGGKTDLLGLTKAVNEAATTDLIGEELYPGMRRVIGRADAGDEQFLKLVDDWHASGSHRLDENGDN